MPDLAARTWSIPCGKQMLHLGERTLIMGILNVTPDSFSDGGRHLEVSTAVPAALAMLAEGADIIDVGGESTRPGHTALDVTEEINRVVPVIESIRRAAPDALISIDTSKAAVAEAAFAAGAHMLNDVWGLQRDPKLAHVAAKYQVPVVVMHNQGDTHYQDLMGDILAYLQRSIQTAEAAGLSAEMVIVDPGIGFGKTVAHNLEVLRKLAKLKALCRPILLGTSRKSTIGKVLGGLPPEDRVEGTAATIALGIAEGADIVRVHDVRYMKRVSVMTDAIVRPGRGGFVSD